MGKIIRETGFRNFRSVLVLSCDAGAGADYLEKKGYEMVVPVPVGTTNAQVWVIGKKKE